MLTMNELNKIRSGLPLAKDKVKYLESFGIFHDPVKSSPERSMTAWIEHRKQVAIKELEIKQKNMQNQMNKLGYDLGNIVDLIDEYKE
jgi:hypothetical protein